MSGTRWLGLGLVVLVMATVGAPAAKDQFVRPIDHIRSLELLRSIRFGSGRADDDFFFNHLDGDLVPVLRAFDHQRAIVGQLGRSDVARKLARTVRVQIVYRSQYVKH